MIEREQLAWAAGLFCGEGSIFRLGKNGGCIALAMTDKESVDKFAKIVGMGNVRVRSNGNYKTVYDWRAARFEHVQATIALLWMWLSLEKRGSAVKCLARMKAGRRSPGTGPDTSKTHCKHGHEFTGNNTYIDKTGYKVCKACRNISSKKSQSKK